MEAQKPVVELELYFIRHGESMGNVGYGRDNLTFEEKHDPLLTEKGVMQAADAGEFLKETDFDYVYSSGLLRAVQTATEILKKQPTEKELNILPLLTEVGVKPEYEGADISEIREFRNNAVVAKDVDTSKPLVCYSQFSNEDELFARAEETVKYLLSHHRSGEKVAVVSHAAFLTIVIFWIMGFKDKCPVFDIDINNTGITKVIFYKEGTNKYGDIVFKYINSTAHLK